MSCLAIVISATYHLTISFFKDTLLMEKAQRTGLIGNGYWGKILHSKLGILSDVMFVHSSQDDFASKLAEVDWVFVATPNQTHYEIVRKCILSGVNVFCEKPLTLSLRDTESLFSLAEANNVRLYVDHVFKYRKEYPKLISALTENLKNIKAVWEKSPRGKMQENPQDIIYRLTYHDLYLLYDHLGSKMLERVKSNDARASFLAFQAVFDGVHVEFFYGSCDKGENGHHVAGIKFPKHSNDALLDMLTDVLKGKCNFQRNKEESLFATRVIEEVQRIWRK